MVDDLYQEIILDHSKRPRNCHAMQDATSQAEGYNPLCGDKLKLYLKMEGDTVKDDDVKVFVVAIPGATLRGNDVIEFLVPRAPKFMIRTALRC